MRDLLPYTLNIELIWTWESLSWVRLCPGCGYVLGAAMPWVQLCPGCVYVLGAEVMTKDLFHAQVQALGDACIINNGLNVTYLSLCV